MLHELIDLVPTTNLIPNASSFFMKSKCINLVWFLLEVELNPDHKCSTHNLQGAANLIPSTKFQNLEVFFAFFKLETTSFVSFSFFPHFKWQEINFIETPWPRTIRKRRRRDYMRLEAAKRRSLQLTLKKANSNA